MEYDFFTTNDGLVLAFQTSLPLAAAAASPLSKTCLLLLHGFSGSSAYFHRNVPAFSAVHWVIAPDLRGHGRSARSRGGYHVARLAADLAALLAHLRAHAPHTRVLAVGCSVGAAILWTHAELFGPPSSAGLAGLVLVDQAPLQNRSPFGTWDATRAHARVYDEATLRAAQRLWTEHPAAAHRALVAECLGYRAAPDPVLDRAVTDAQREADEAFFVGVSAQSDGAWLARLLEDHTRYDHREACEAIDVPTLVMAGRRTACFPLEGLRETVARVNKARPGLAKWSLLDGGHWLFYDEAERFNREILEFVDGLE